MSSKSSDTSNPSDLELVSTIMWLAQAKPNVKTESSCNDNDEAVDSLSDTAEIISSKLNEKPFPERITRPLPCLCCRMQRKKCDLVRPACARCIYRGTECIYPTGRKPYKKRAPKQLSGKPSSDDSISVKSPASLSACSSNTSLDTPALSIPKNEISGSKVDEISGKSAMSIDFLLL
ncbi:hypothetical protein HK100_011854 [Physocladia obscura]|uniref:Zn(2)-C6 fungal-type domain-containing protein n=1 Tax=Physocladia obscura TaxID=109957 RepID=A0AAD5T3J0_9FUNG|nr:hypothetical protein HK100_011854 [Physocladia obscura]